MPKLHLTKSAIDELAPCYSETVYWDDCLPGFGLKVTPQGRKVFIVLYRTKDGHSRLRKYTIGTYGQTTLAIARIAAQRVLADRNEGKDPARAKRDLREKVVTDIFDADADHITAPQLTVQSQVKKCQISSFAAQLQFCTN